MSNLNYKLSLNSSKEELSFSLSFKRNLFSSKEISFSFTFSSIFCLEIISNLFLNDFSQVLFEIK
jgi:hypothetical protein